MGGGHGAMVMGVEVVLGEGGGEGTNSLKDWFTTGFVVSPSLRTGGTSLRTCPHSSLRTG